jgi:hypothetical protein
MNAHCYIGASGWIYSHWRGVFYPPELPQARWYEHYSQHFETVEINTSFYRFPGEKAFDRWQAPAPARFVYALKANRYLTHLKRLKDVAEPLERFLLPARRLGDKLGPMLWQLPPRWHADQSRLESFAALLPTDLAHVLNFVTQPGLPRLWGRCWNDLAWFSAFLICPAWRVHSGLRGIWFTCVFTGVVNFTPGDMDRRGCGPGPSVSGTGWPRGAACMLILTTTPTARPCRMRRRCKACWAARISCCLTPKPVFAISKLRAVCFRVQKGVEWCKM